MTFNASAGDTPAALSASALTASIGDVKVLHDISLQLRPGCWTSIVGPNGAGKSTLLRVLAGLLAHSGELCLSGNPLRNLSPGERARRVSWLGQNEIWSGDMTVYDVTMLGRMPHQAWLALPSERDHREVERALRATQVWDRRHRTLAQLSGGERQRALLARAFAVQADIFLMDEPLAGLDPPHQTDWLLLVRDLVSSGKTVVSALHEVTCALQADELLVMQSGRVTHQGPCADEATHRAVESVFAMRVAIHRVANQWVALPRL